MHSRSLITALAVTLGVIACSGKGEGTARRDVSAREHDGDAPPRLEPPPAPAATSAPLPERRSPPPPAPEATTDSQPPADFPFALPAAQPGAVFNRVVRPDGAKVFTAELETADAGLELLAQQLQTSFEREGLTVERTDYPGTDAAMIRLVAKQAGGREGSATLSTSTASPHVRVVVGWSEASAAAN